MNCPHCTEPDFICLDCVRTELGISRWQVFRARVGLWWQNFRRKV